MPTTMPDVGRRGMLDVGRISPLVGSKGSLGRSPPDPVGSMLRGSEGRIPVPEASGTCTEDAAVEPGMMKGPVMTEPPVDTGCSVGTTSAEVGDTMGRGMMPEEPIKGCPVGRVIPDDGSTPVDPTLGSSEVSAGGAEVEGMTVGNTPVDPMMKGMGRDEEGATELATLEGGTMGRGSTPVDPMIGLGSFDDGSSELGPDVEVGTAWPVEPMMKGIGRPEEDGGAELGTTSEELEGIIDSGRRPVEPTTGGGMISG